MNIVHLCSLLGFFYSIYHWYWIAFGWITILWYCVYYWIV